MGLLGHWWVGKFEPQHESPHEDHHHEGSVKPSFTTSLIERQEEHRLSNPEAAWLAGNML